MHDTQAVENHKKMFQKKKKDHFLISPLVIKNMLYATFSEVRK